MRNNGKDKQIFHLVDALCTPTKKARKNLKDFHGCGVCKISYIVMHVIL